MHTFVHMLAQHADMRAHTPTNVCTRMHQVAFARWTCTHARLTLHLCQLLGCKNFKFLLILSHTATHSSQLLLPWRITIFVLVWISGQWSMRSCSLMHTLPVARQACTKPPDHLPVGFWCCCHTWLQLYIHTILSCTPSVIRTQQFSLCACQLSLCEITHACRSCCKIHAS